jgi:hypothetical protein
MFIIIQLNLIDLYEIIFLKNILFFKSKFIFLNYLFQFFNLL